MHAIPTLVPCCLSVRLRRYSDSFHISAVRDDSSSAPPVPGDCADYSPIWDQTRMASAVTKANNITQTCVHLAPHVPAWLCASTSVMGALLNRRPGAHVVSAACKPHFGMDQVRGFRTLHQHYQRGACRRRAPERPGKGRCCIGRGRAGGNDRPR